jgi:hypothetical protein
MPGHPAPFQCCLYAQLSALHLHTLLLHSCTAGPAPAPQLLRIHSSCAACQSSSARAPPPAFTVACAAPLVRSRRTPVLPTLRRLTRAAPLLHTTGPVRCSCRAPRTSACHQRPRAPVLARPRRLRALLHASCALHVHAQRRTPPALGHRVRTPRSCAGPCQCVARRRRFCACARATRPALAHPREPLARLRRRSPPLLPDVARARLHHSGLRARPPAAAPASRAPAPGLGCSPSAAAAMGKREGKKSRRG